MKWNKKGYILLLSYWNSNSFCKSKVGDGYGSYL